MTVTSPRRSPEPADRQRDAERTRAALIEAAMAEFAGKGLAGARVGAIAERAGVNKQLISYYFGGKQGLYEAILQRWYDAETELSDPAVSLSELAWRYLAAGQSSPDMQRLFLRESLDQDLAEVVEEPDAPDIQDLRRRQADGELAPELDPRVMLLFLQAMVVSAVVFPGDVKRLTGLDPQSAEYFELAGQQLRLVVERLRDSP